MSNNLLQTELLISYIDGDISADKNALLQKQLEMNKAMQQELDNLLLAKDVVRNYALANKVAEIHKKMMSEQDTLLSGTKAPVRYLPMRLMKYAAAIIIFLGLLGLYQYLTLSTDKLYNEKYSEYSLSKLRGNDTFTAIEKGYSEKNYDDVITIIKNKNNASVKEKFLAGQAYLSEGNYAEAIIFFKQVLSENSATHTGILSDDSEYYLALSYLKTNRVSEALPLFKKIHTNKNHLYHNKVSGSFLRKIQLFKWKQQ